MTQVTWLTVPGAVSYQVQYRKQGTQTWTLLPTVPASATTTVVPGLSASTVYDFLVSATGVSPQSLSITTPATSTTATESAQDFVVLAGVTAAIYNSTLEAWTITAGGQVAVNGIADAKTSGVVMLLYHNRRVYQKNVSNDFYDKSVSADAWSGPKTDPRIAAPPPPASGVTAPAPAAAQSYTTLVINADMSSPSQVSTDLSGNTVAALYGWNQFGQANGTNAGLSASGFNFSNGELVITGSGSFGQGLATACSSSPATSTHGAIGKNTGKGLAFRYGYFEAVLGWDFTVPGNRTFWLNYLVSSILEIDIMESFGGQWPATPASAIHKWGGSDRKNNGPDVPFGGPLSALVVKSGVSYNKFGLLWTPAFMQIFINDQPGPQVDCNKTLNWWDFGKNGPPYSGSGSINDYAAAKSGFLYLQTGIWPGSGQLHIKSIRAWQ